MSIEVMTVIASDWLESDLDWVGLPKNKVLALVRGQAKTAWPGVQVGCGFLKRSFGDDPRPDIDPACKIIEVFQWLKLVAVVTDRTVERALSDIPSSVRASRKIGDPWYEVIAHVVLPAGTC